MLKKVMLVFFVIVFSMGVFGCESEAEKQEAAVKKQQQEAHDKAIKGGIVKSPKREW